MSTGPQLGAYMFNVAKREAEAVLWPGPASEVEHVGTELGPGAHAEHVHWDAALADLVVVEEQGHRLRGWREVNPQVVPGVVVDLPRIAPPVGVVVGRERNEPIRSCALGVAGGKQSDDVSSVGPEEELHVGADVAPAMSFKGEGEACDRGSPAFGIGIAVAELNVRKGPVRHLPLALGLTDGDLPLTLGEGVLPACARVLAAPASAGPVATTSRDVRVLHAKVLGAEALARSTKLPEVAVPWSALLARAVASRRGHRPGCGRGCGRRPGGRRRRRRGHGHWRRRRPLHALRVPRVQDLAVGTRNAAGVAAPGLAATLTPLSGAWAGCGGGRWLRRHGRGRRLGRRRGGRAGCVCDKNVSA